MANTPTGGPTPAGSSPDPDPFAGGIVDDVEAREQARDWAYDELREGRSPESVEAELRANGWSPDDAADLAEEARRRTRHLRGVVTRDDVARASEDAYRHKEVNPFNDGYIGTPEAFKPDAAAGQANVTPGGGPPPNHPAADPDHQKRLRRSRVRAMLQMAGGGVVLFVGVMMTIALATSSSAEDFESYALAGGIVLVGGLVFANGLRGFVTPVRLVSRFDRGLLDRRDSR